MPALERRLETQDDLVFRYAGLDQAVGKPFLRAVILNPDPSILDVDMQNAAMNPPLTVPTYCYKLVMSVSPVQDRLEIYRDLVVP
jgi:hypothetical protein